MAHGTKGGCRKDEEVGEDLLRVAYRRQITIDWEHDQQCATNQPGDVAPQRLVIDDLAAPLPEQQPNQRGNAHIAGDINPEERGHANRQPGEKKLTRASFGQIGRKEKDGQKRKEQPRKHDIAIKGGGGQEQADRKCGDDCQYEGGQECISDEEDDQRAEGAHANIIQSLGDDRRPGNLEDQRQRIGLTGRVEGPVVAKGHFALQQSPPADQGQPFVIDIERRFDRE